MRVFFLLIVTILNLSIQAQDKVLVPYRSGDLFGLSDLDGKVKLKPNYDYVEPIGEGYFKFSNYETIIDTVRYYDGRIELNEKRITRAGVLRGTKLVIDETEHRHFSVVPGAMLIGSWESYISKNSNFYTLEGRKLLNENVEKFRLMGPGFEAHRGGGSAFLSIVAEHYDKTVSILVFDVKNQVMIEPVLDHVKDFNLDRNSSSDNTLVCTYTDADYNYYHSRIYYDPQLGYYVRAPYSERRNDYEYQAEDMYYGGDVEMVEMEVEEVPVMVTEEMPKPKAPESFHAAPAPPVAPVHFIKLSNAEIKCGLDTIHILADEKIDLADRYSDHQRHPLIISKGEKRGLIFSSTERGELLYDSLRYIKNQYGIFTSSHNFLYLAGIKDQESGQWAFGLLDGKGDELIPLMYEYLTPNLPVIYIAEDEQRNNDHFGFRQPYTYSDDIKQLLTLYQEGIFLAKKNGKFGVIDSGNKIILPFEYEMLWENDLSFLKTMKVEDDFYVYQKADSYGAFKLNSKKEISMETGPVFPDVPVYVYRNYGNIQGFDLYNLATAKDLYLYLGGNNGKIYRRPSRK